MKKVRFKIEEMPKINYARHEIVKELRDKYAQYLIRTCFRKLESAEIADEFNVRSYIILIFEKALELRCTERELERLESRQDKFPFLFYGTRNDEMIHGWLTMFLSLCNKRQKSVESLVTNHPIFDELGNQLSLKRGLDWEYLQALRDDVASLTKECIREFLCEMRTFSRILTSDELAENDKLDDKEDNYSDDEFESYSDNDKPIANNNGDSKIEAYSLDIIINEQSDSNANIAIARPIEENYNSNPLLNYFLSWIYEFPEWLQKQIINSVAIEAFIESIEIYNLLFIVDYIINAQLSNIISNSLDNVEDDMHEKAEAFELSAALVDMNIILRESSISGLILPTIGSGNIFANDIFNGVEIF